MNIIHLMTAKFLALCCLLSASLAISVKRPSDFTLSFLQRKNGTGVGGGICQHIGEASICDESAFGCHFVEGSGCESNEEQPDLISYEDLGENEIKLLENFVAGDDLLKMMVEEGIDLTQLSEIEPEK